jgi:hypothetical protein
MVDYHPYPVVNMPNDFDLYPHQEQHFSDYVQTSQSYLPSNYNVDPSFSAPYEPVGMPAMAEAPAPEDLQFHYDGIAQGVKPGFQYSPQGSPNSESHSFEQPPVLSASSESGASVSSSNMPSPSLNPQFTEPWNPMVNSLGLPVLQSTSGFEYEGLVADKVPGCVGESTKVSLRSSQSSSVTLPPNHSAFPSPRPEAAQANVFKSPASPASAARSASRSTTLWGRRNSILSNEVLPSDIHDAALRSPCSVTPVTPPLNFSTIRSPSCWFPILLFSCRI